MSHYSPTGVFNEQCHATFSSRNPGLLGVERLSFDPCLSQFRKSFSQTVTCRIPLPPTLQPDHELFVINLTPTHLSTMLSTTSQTLVKQKVNNKKKVIRDSVSLPIANLRQFTPSIDKPGKGKATLSAENCRDTPPIDACKGPATVCPNTCHQEYYLGRKKTDTLLVLPGAPRCVCMAPMRDVLTSVKFGLTCVTWRSFFCQARTASYYYGTWHAPFIS